MAAVHIWKAMVALTLQLNSYRAHTESDSDAQHTAQWLPCNMVMESDGDTRHTAQ